MRALWGLFLFLAAGALAAESPLYWAIANNDALAVWKLTAPEGAPEQLEENGLAPTAWAVQKGSGEVLQVLAWRGVPLDGVDAHGRNLLFSAAALGRVDLFDRIAAAGADPMRVDEDGRNLVHAAAPSPHLEMLARVLARGPSAVQRSALGVTPLMMACWGGHSAAVKLLLRWGAVPDDQDYLGRSVRDYAGWSGDPKTLEVIDLALTRWTIEPADGAPLP